MKGQAFINDKDIWLTWKASLCKGTYEQLLKPAPMKEYIVNNSRAEHGVRIVANKTNSKIDSRSFSINLYIEGRTQEEYISNVESFMDEISSGLFSFKVPQLNKVYKLVYTDCSNYGDYGLRKGKFVIKLSEPNVKDRTVIS